MENATFYHQVVEFNWRPANYMHNSWLSDWINDQTIDMIKTQTMANITLNEFIFNYFALKGEVKEDEYNKPLVQLLLLPTAELSKLVLFLGVTVNHLSIRQIICGEQQRKLRTFLGEQAYLYGMNRASFLLESDSLLDIFGREPLQEENNSDQYFMQIGFKLFAIMTCELSDAIKSRLVLKFPNGSAEYLLDCWQQILTQYTTNEQTFLSLKAQVESLLFKVTKELYPQWTPVLAS
jgi:hypothetical protein